MTLSVVFLLSLELSEFNCGNHRMCDIIVYIIQQTFNIFGCTYHQI